jgi:hypothetical protein
MAYVAEQVAIGGGGGIILHAPWLITAFNNLPGPIIHLATEATIRGLFKEAVRKYIASILT